jgi:hypothetical protein
MSYPSAAADPWCVQNPLCGPEHRADWPGEQAAAGKQQQHYSPCIHIACAAVCEGMKHLVIKGTTTCSSTAAHSAPAGARQQARTAYRQLGHCLHMFVPCHPALSAVLQAFGVFLAAGSFLQCGR